MNVSLLTERIICDVKKIPCPDDKRVDVWTAITLQISSRDSCDYAYIEIVEDVINKYVSKLKGKALRTLWKETESGIQHQGDDSGFFASTIRDDLEMELLDMITERAWEDGRP